MYTMLNTSITRKSFGEAVGVTKLLMPHLANYSYAGSIFYCHSKGDDGKVLIDITVGCKMGDIRNITSVLYI